MNRAAVVKNTNTAVVKNIKVKEQRKNNYRTKAD